MAFFVVVYDRDRGVLIRQTEYEEQKAALDARFGAEREFWGRADIEVVAFSAESEEELRRTHARYFLDLKQLAARMG